MNSISCADYRLGAQYGRFRILDLSNSPVVLPTFIRTGVLFTILRFTNEILPIACANPIGQSFQYQDFRFTFLDYRCNGSRSWGIRSRIMS